MPAAKLTRADREHVAATYAATAGDAVETAKRHGLTRWHVSQLAKRGQWPSRPLAIAKAAQQAQDAAAAVVIRANPSAVNSVNVTAADAISASISENRAASSALAHAENRRALEALARRKPIAIRNMRDLGEAAKIAEPKDSGATQVTLNLAFFGGSGS